MRVALVTGYLCLVNPHFKLFYMSQTVLVQEEPRGPSVLIEIPVTINGQQRIPVPDISQLRSTTDLKIILKGLRLISNEVLTNGIINGAVNAPPAELAKMSLTIYAEGWEKGQTIPLLTLNDMEFTVGAIPFRRSATRFDNWVNVDWPKSYLQLANGTVTAGAPYVVLIDCEYQRLDAQNRLVVGSSR
jgi:hypothetical protein